MNPKVQKRLPKAAVLRNPKSNADYHITITAREYALLYNVYLSAERLSQSRYVGADPVSAENDLNKALSEYEGWSENEPSQLRTSRARCAFRAVRRGISSN